MNRIQYFRAVWILKYFRSARLRRAREEPDCRLMSQREKAETGMVSDTDEQFYDPRLFYIASIARCYPGKAKGSGDLRPAEALRRAVLTTGAGACSAAADRFDRQLCRTMVIS